MHDRGVIASAELAADLGKAARGQLLGEIHGDLTRLQAALRGRAPLLLLDEVAAHLDGDHRAALFHEISDIGAQAWLTGVERSVFETFGGAAQYVAVEAGTVTPE